jgi:hypothetical protein
MMFACSRVEDNLLAFILVQLCERIHFFEQAQQYQMNAMQGGGNFNNPGQGMNPNNPVCLPEISFVRVIQRTHLSHT